METFGCRLTLRDQFQKEFNENPLEPDEFRRIEGMGSYYVCLEPEHCDEQCMFALTLDDQKY